jgi:plastocyanin
MRKVLAVSAVLLMLVALGAGAAAASGGGGCGEDVTEEAGKSVAISQYCFEPAVLYASPGTVITWTNQDPDRHTVLGSNGAWGSFEALRSGATASYSFDKPGVYAYVCTWHPGMSGAVVVGDGGLERLDIAPVSRVLAGGRADDQGPGAGIIVIALAGGAALMLLITAGFSRRKRGTSGT